MSERKRFSGKTILIGIISFAAIFAATFFGVQYFTKSGVFKIPGVVKYDESLSPDEVAVLQGIFTKEVVLDADVTVSAYGSLVRPELKSGEFLYNVAVPVTDFYSTEENIVVERAEELFNNCEECPYRMINVRELDFTKKLLRINGAYYLDGFDSGAVFRVIRFESEKYSEEIEPLVANAMKREFPEKSSVLTLAQTGVTALSRGMNRKLNEVGDAAFFAQYIGEYLSKFDLTHTSNEASFSEYASESNICSDPRFIGTLTAIGLDIVELTGNHNVDCGDADAAATIDVYANNGIRTYGGGVTVDAAAVPLDIAEKGNKVTMLAYNLSTGGATYDDTPGANQYYEEVAAEQISAAKKRGDLVIVDIQYYECSMYVNEEEDTTCDYADSAAGDQVGFFRHLINLGADVVVGTSAHQPQTFELYGDGVIYYGLGNLFFDQAWWPGTTRSLILVHHIYQDKLLQTEVVPTAYDGNYQTRLLDEETKKWFIGRLISERP